MLRTGVYFTVNVEGHAGILTPDDLARQVTALLVASGSVDVAKNVVLPARDLVSDLLAGNLLSWDYLAHTTVHTLADMDEDAAVALVRQAFGAVTSYEPTGASAAPSSGVLSRLLHPSTDAPTPDQPAPGVFDGVRDFFSGLNDDVRLVLYGIIAIVIVVVALVAFGPNIPKLATIRL